MKTLNNFINPGLRFVFTDIDDTLTSQGRLTSLAFQALWRLNQSGVAVIPVTGRPAGWCELIARQWPVAGVIGENGGLYFRYIESGPERGMKRHYFFENSTRLDNQKRLDKIRTEILTAVPGSRVASDQFCRQLDLAIDYCEDVKALPPIEVEKIVNIFKRHGAQAKVSSIHVNGWFGEYDKLKMCQIFCQREFDLDLAAHQKITAFVGDSPNDEPMFEFFENSFAVSNVQKFVKSMKHLPQFVSVGPGGDGFSEIVDRILAKL
jgi:HAD superfamily hydrolase (TIGR01484 family)